MAKPNKPTLRLSCPPPGTLSRDAPVKHFAAGGALGGLALPELSQGDRAGQNLMADLSGLGKVATQPGQGAGASYNWNTKSAAEIAAASGINPNGAYVPGGPGDPKATVSFGQGRAGSVTNQFPTETKSPTLPAVASTSPTLGQGLSISNPFAEAPKESTFQQDIEARQSRITAYADRLKTMEALDEARKQAAGPLYDRVRQTTLAVDPVLDSILERASNAFGIAKQLAKVNGQKFSLDEATPGLNTLLNTQQQKAVPLSQLDTLKRAIYDIEQGHINPETGRLSELGNAYKDLRRELVAKIDNLTTDPKTGESFYRAARDAYAGPSELRAAANLGNQAMSKDAWKIGQMTEGMSSSELEAFRIGAFESLRKKFGTEGGQTQIMKMWKEPATAEKLKELFADQSAFRRFAADVAKEARLKRLESVGRGSQTAARAAGMGDVDMAAVTEAGNIARSAATGNVPGMLGSATNLWNRVKTPEAVRDQMGEILMAKGQQGAQNISEIKRIAEQVRQEKARRATQAGTFAGLL